MASFSRRKLFKAAGASGVAALGVAALAGCGETQIVEVEKVVTVEKVVEKIVTQEAMEPQIQRTEIVFWDWWSPSANVINEV